MKYRGSKCNGSRQSSYALGRWLMNPEDFYVVVVMMHDHGIGKRLEQHEQELPTHEDKPQDGIS